MIVLDSSVAIAALTGHRPSREAVAGQRLLAPHVIDIEIAHGLRGLVIGRKLPAPDAERVLELWLRLAVDRVPMAPFLHRVWELKDNLTAYDAVFVAVAEGHGVPLLTADRRLAAAVGPKCPIQLIPV